MFIWFGAVADNWDQITDMKNAKYVESGQGY